MEIPVKNCFVGMLLTQTLECFQTSLTLNTGQTHAMIQIKPQKLVTYHTLLHAKSDLYNITEVSQIMQLHFSSRHCHYNFFSRTSGSSRRLFNVCCFAIAATTQKPIIYIPRPGICYIHTGFLFSASYKHEETLKI